MKPIECLFKGFNIDESMDDVQHVDDLSVLYDTMVMSKFGFVEKDIIQSITVNSNQISSDVVVNFFHRQMLNESYGDDLLNIILSLGKDITLLKNDIFYTSFSDDLDLYPLFKLLAMHYDHNEFGQIFNYYHPLTRNDDLMTVKDRFIMSYVKREDIYSFISFTKPYIKQFLDEWVGIMESNYSDDWYKSV